MRGRRPSPHIPGQPVGAASPTPRETSRQRPSPGQPPAEGSRPLPTDRTIDACLRKPPGRACPAPTARRPGNGCPRKPHSVSISPSVGRGALTPPRPSAAALLRANRRGAASPTPRGALRCRQQQPLPSPSGEGGPAGPDEGQASAAAHSRATRRGRRPRRPAKPSANTHPPGNHPQTSAHANPRAGHARPLPRNNPTHLYTT